MLRIDSSNRFGSSGLGSESVSTTFDIPANAKSATISFDMILADSWDNEEGRVSINSEEVASVESNWRKEAPRFDATGGDLIQVSANHIDSYQATGTWNTNSSQMDHAYCVSIDVQNPGETVTLGFGTSLNQHPMDETHLIESLKVQEEQIEKWQQQQIF